MNFECFLFLFEFLRWDYNSQNIKSTFRGKRRRDNFKFSSRPTIALLKIFRRIFLRTKRLCCLILCDFNQKLFAVDPVSLLLLWSLFLSVTAETIILCYILTQGDKKRNQEALKAKSHIVPCVWQRDIHPVFNKAHIKDSLKFVLPLEII